MKIELMIRTQRSFQLDGKLLHPRGIADAIVAGVGIFQPSPVDSDQTDGWNPSEFATRKAAS